MDKITPTRFFKRFSRPQLGKFGIFVAFGAALISPLAQAQTVYSFNTGGVTGPTEPSQADINAAYANTTLDNKVTVNNGIQYFTVPHNGIYKIQAVGASGGYDGGHGANITGDFNLTAGTVLKILVGQKGTMDFNGQFYAGGGGGGSFVTDNFNSILVIAGGGGGNGDGYGGQTAPCCNTTMEASLVNNGNPYPSGSNGGTNGNGGFCSWGSDAGGGAGFSGNGPWCNAGSQAMSFINGGTAGLGNNLTGDGGFGGGGGCYNSGTGQRGGGGGGYSGGSGGIANTGPDAAGGGGGSYNNGSSPVSMMHPTRGDGFVVITDMCDLKITASSNPMCAGGSATLSTNATSGIQWTPGGSTNSSIIVTPASTTTYSMVGKGSSPACLNLTRTVVVTIGISPLPNVSGVVNPPLLCIGSTATITGTGASTYTWAATGTPGNTVGVTPIVSTVYNVTGTSAFGCVNSGTVMVNVNTNVLGGTPNSTICKGKSITLSGSGGAKYLWNGTQPFQSIVVTPVSSTVYTVEATDQFGCVLSRTISVTVNTPPTLNAAADKSTICLGESFNLTASGASTYTWNTNATTANVAVTPTVDLNHVFTVKGTNSDGCVGTKTVAVLVSKCAGLDEATTALSKIFPNPNHGAFAISIPGFSEAVTINIYNALGSLVKTQKINSADSEVNIQQEPNGLYFVHLVKEGKTVQISKIVKQ